MRVLILGGGYAGVACATRLAHRARKAGKAVDITLLNESDLFVERIRLHQAATGQPLIMLCSDVLRSVIQIRTDGARIDAIHAITSPQKLARVARELGLSVTSE